MANNGSYPSGPFRPNFVDIRSWQLYPEKATSDGKISGAGYSTSDWVQIYAAGCTLESGVTIKAANPVAGLYSQLQIATYDNHNHTGTTGGSGFALDGNEEVHIPIRQLSHIYVRKTSGGGGPWYTWRAH